MQFLSEICCICLEREKDLQNLNQIDNVDDNITYYNKLATIIPEIIFEEIHKNCMICSKCCPQLTAFNIFREQCVKSTRFLVKTYISGQCSNNNKLPKTNLAQFKNNEGLFDIFDSDYIVMSGAQTNDNDRYISTEKEVAENGKCAGSNSCNTSDTIKENLIDEEIIIKPEPEDTLTYEEEELQNENEVKTELEPTLACQNDVSGTGEAFSEVDPLPLSNTSSNIIITEEIGIKSDHEDEGGCIEENEEIASNTDIDVSVTGEIFSEVDPLSLNNTSSNILVTEEIDIKSDHEDQSECIEENEEIATNTDIDVSGTGEAFSEVDPLSLNNTSSNILITEEIDIKSDHEDEGGCIEENEEIPTNTDIEPLPSAPNDNNLKDIAVTSESIKEKLVYKPYFNMFKCKQCDKEFLLHSRLKKHERTHTGEKPFSCDECEKSFTQSNSLLVHKRTHSGVKPFECDICGRTFTYNSALTCHRKTHSGDKPFKCDHCPKAFTRLTHLTLHQNIHKGLKPYECTECKKTFTRPSCLKTHQVTHTKARPFKCDICQKTFSRDHCLYKHKRVHSGAKPYKCDLCDRKFSQISSLAAHKKTHTDLKPFSCEECGKKFAQSMHLVQHKRSHSGEKPFPCSQCGKFFAYSSNLAAHRKIHANVQPANSQD